MVVIVKCNNGIVTDKYLEVIGNSFKEVNCGDVKYVSNYKDALEYDKDTVVVVARIVDAIQLFFRKYNRIVMWFQGIEPEESYMTHHSKFRFYILNYLEKYIIQHSVFKFFVSEEMILHYERKYKLKLEKDTYYCMPCLNTGIHTAAFKADRKYENNYFAYVGSMAVWQKFEETVNIYKKIEKLGLENTKLFVFTGEKQKAEEILKRKGVEKYSIDFVSNNKLSKALEGIKYGFIIREDTAVNRVATPTKISTYLSCGLIPIYSSCLKDFDAIAQKMKFVICDNEIMYKKLNYFNDYIINSDEIYCEYEKIFNSYYSEKVHSDSIKQLLKKSINIGNNR